MAKIRKALVASFGAAASALGAFMLDGSVDSSELVMAAGAGLVFGFATWATRNRRA